MSKRLPPLNALRVFDAAARHLSFTKAADELFVTQAAVSHQIKSLEDFLGLKLFRRRNRSLLLTEEGQSYYLDIKEIFTSINEATRKLQARSAKGALTVSLPPSFAIQWLVPRLSGFNAAYPGIDVRIQAVDREEDKLADDVDVAIFYGRGNWTGLRTERLYAEFLLPVCAPTILTGEHGLKVPADLANHTLLHDTSRRDWMAYTRQLGVPQINVQQGPIFSHSAMVVQAAVHGQRAAKWAGSEVSGLMGQRTSPCSAWSSCRPKSASCAHRAPLPPHSWRADRHDPPAFPASVASLHGIPVAENQTQPAPGRAPARSVLRAVALC